MRKVRILDETTIVEESTNENGDRHYNERHIIEVEREPSGLKDALMGLLAFSMSGLFIYASWMTVIVFFHPTSTPTQITQKR